MSTLVVCALNPAEVAALAACRRAIRAADRMGLRVDGFDLSAPERGINESAAIADSFSPRSHERRAMLAICAALGELVLARWARGAP